MSMFAYKGININGSIVKGSIESESIDNAHNSLTLKGLNILSIKNTNISLSGHLKVFFAGKAARRDVIEFVKNMATILKAGIPLLDALEDIGQAIEKKSLKNAVSDIKERVTSGSNLSDALYANSFIFPEILIRLVRVGEETGRLELSLTQVADHLERIEELSGTIKRALMYPVFVLTTTCGALIFWMIYVVPKLLSVIKEMGGKLPLMTRIMLFMSNFIQSYWYVIPFILFAVFISIKLAKRNDIIKYYLDMIKIRLPIVKLFLCNKYLASFSEQMKIMTVAGITVDRSLVIVANSIGSEVFKKAIINIKDKILSGSRISEAMRTYDIFPRMVVRMVDVGESSGNLDGQFSFLSDFYFKKLDDLSEKLGKMIEPIMMTVVGGIFVVMIMAILLPIYDVVSKFK